MIDWSNVNYFHPGRDKFSENPDEYADPILIYKLDIFRSMLGTPIYPSPAPGALARFDESARASQHYAVDRKSTAIDVFCTGSISAAWTKAVSCGLWGGIGVYFDTVYQSIQWPMLHLDIRSNKDSQPRLWYRDNKTYHFIGDSAETANKLVRRLGIYG